MHEVLVNRLGGLSLPRKSVVRLTDRPDMTLDVYRGRKTTTQQEQQFRLLQNVPGTSARRNELCRRTRVCVCIPILVTTFPDTEPLPHTPDAVRPSALCL